VGNPLEGRKACRIFELAEGDVPNEADHADYIDFFVDAAERLRQAIAAVDGSLL
jgi:hypothetical protein